MTGSGTVLFAVSVAGLLMTPGPTNMLLMAAGATLGARRAAQLIPFELAAYLLSIGIMTVILLPLVEDHEILILCMKLLAAAYLLRSAYRFWSARNLVRPPQIVSASLVFCTTLLNPKVLILSFVVFPNEGLILAYGIFIAISLSVACGWILLGCGLLRWSAGKHVAHNIYAVAAGVHTLFAATIIYSTGVLILPNL